MPMMPFIGVRISWLMFARNSLFEPAGGLRGQLGLLQFQIRFRQRGTRRGKTFARALQPRGRAADLLLKSVKTQRHVADFVARMDHHRREIEVGLGRFEIARGQRPHRAGEIGQRPFDQLVGGLGNFDRGMRDHARQDQARRQM